MPTSRTTILLLGASGYVGQAYQKLFAQQGVQYVAADRTKFDYRQREGLRGLIELIQPQFVINSAGYTGKPNVDACEIHKAECLEGNAVFPGIVKEVCAETKTPWGHVSSGCIYNGARADGRGFSEEDVPNFSFRTNNCSFYSGTKALGEEILKDAPECFIWRLRIPFNQVNNPRNYLTKMMAYSRLLSAHNSLSQLDEFVRATWECWAKRLPFGIYNVTNPGSVTTEEVVDLIKAAPVGQELLAQGKVFSFFGSEEEFMRLAAITPRSNCVMDSSKLAGVGVKMTEVHEAIAQALARWETGS